MGLALLAPPLLAPPLLAQTLPLPTTVESPLWTTDGVRAAALVAIAAAALVVLLGSLTGDLGQGGTGGHRAGGRLFRALRGWLAVGAAAAAIASPSLTQVAGFLLAASVLELSITIRGKRAIPAWTVGILSPVALWLAAYLRREAGGETTIDWLGTPFGGDLSTTLAFVALAIPLALPGALGGVWAGLACGPDTARRARLGYGLASSLRPITYATLVSLTFAGSDLLLQLGVVILWTMPVIALLQRCTSRQLASLGHAAFWALLAAQAAATERSADAFALGLIGLALPLSALSISLALVRAEEAERPGFAPLGVARLFPVTFWACLVSAAAAAGFPFLGAFHGRVRGAGALELDGEGLGALAVALAAAPLFALVTLPWIHRVFLCSPLEAQAQPAEVRRREPRLFLVAVFLAAAGSLALGFAPSLVAPWLPFNDLAPVAVPSPLGQAQLLLAAALVASFLKGRVFPSASALSSTP